MVRPRLQFVGSRAQLAAHLPTCRFESVKGLLADSDARLAALTQSLETKDQVRCGPLAGPGWRAGHRNTAYRGVAATSGAWQEIEFLKAMLAKLSERVERNERLFEQRIGSF